MNTNRNEVETILQQLIAAHAARDADAIVGLYAPNAVIYDLSPPLGRRGINRDIISSWLSSWDGPIRIDARDVELTISGDLAFSSGLNRMRGRQNGEDQDVWFRTTMCLRKIDGHWQIVHEHSSVPFYMDGSDRAALDLEP